MLLSYFELCKLIDDGVIENSSHSNVNSASIDLVLGKNIMVEKQRDCVINMLDKSGSHLERVVMGDGGSYVLAPGESILAETAEIFHLPNDLSAEYKLKSTMARNFVDHFNAGWADAGWHGSVLTLEITNHNRWHGVRIQPGMKCGQMVFFRHEPVPDDRSYAARGQYNGDKEVTAGKGLK
jgi:deoxycytidine triphosphate deaminase